MEQNDTVGTDEVVEPTEVESSIAYLIYQVAAVNDFFFDVTYSEDWKGWTLEEQLLFRKAVKALASSGNIHREKFDEVVWKGHSNGTVNPLVASLRKQREGDAPGKKATKPTAAEILAKRMKD